MAHRTGTTPAATAAGIAPAGDKVLALLVDLVGHPGDATVRIDIRDLRRGYKEIVVDCGEEFRFVVQPGLAAGIQRP
jgi:hypothetical protein